MSANIPGAWPERTLLQQRVEAHQPAFAEPLAARERPLPSQVYREVADYLTHDRLAHGFLRVRRADYPAERLARGLKNSFLTLDLPDHTTRAWIT